MKGCGKPVAAGLTKNGNPYKTCCRGTKFVKSKLAIKHAFASTKVSLPEMELFCKNIMKKQGVLPQFGDVIFHNIPLFFFLVFVILP